ncbi:APC family permease [Thermodesulfobacteriota bacterium]
MEELKKVLGFWSCFAAAVGLVIASTTLVSLGQGMGIGGGGFLYAMIAAWVLQLFSAMTYGELGTMLPRAGGISTYTLVAMGPLPAIVATFCGYIIVNLLAGPAELAVAGFVFKDVFADWCPPMAFSILLLIFLTVMNLLGTDIFAKVQIFFTTVMIGSIGILGVIGLLEIAISTPDIPAPLSFNPMGWNVFSLLAMGIWLFIGIEFVTPLAEETINPGRNIPWSMFIGLAVILIVKALYGIASIKYVPMDALAESTHPHIDMARALLGAGGGIWIGIVSICATASTVNTVLAAVPRLCYGMAHSGELPSFFGWLHPRFKTPWTGIILLALAMCVVLISGLAGIESIVTYIMAAAWTWILCYIIAHADLIILRYRYPDHKRPYRSPFYPIPQIFGTFGMIYVMIYIYPDPIMRNQIIKLALYFLMGSICYGVLWIKLKMKTRLFNPIPMEEVRH